MAWVRRTYRISEETIQRFERLVPPEQRSQALEALMREEVRRQKREALHRNIAEWLEYMADVNEETTLEWASTDLHGWPKD